MNNYFYVDVDDEITSVIGRLRKEKSEEIFLVVPKRAIISQSLVNLKLLGKEANKLKKKLIFVSPDGNTRKIAEKAGLTVKKYVAQKEAVSDTPNIPSMQKKKTLEPWEEAAAKEELKKAINRDKFPQKSPIPAGAPTKIKAGVFPVRHPIVKKPMPGPALAEQEIKPGKLTKKPLIGEAKSPVVDLKKIAAESRKSLRPVKVEEKYPPAKEEFMPMEEPSLKELIGSTDQAADEPTNAVVPQQPIRPARKMQLAKASPFKVKKLEKPGPAPALVPILPTPPSVSLVAGQVKPEDEKQESLAVSAPTALPKEFERETANLTLKEKERLRDLWMEQKRVVRGKSLQEDTALDLKSSEAVVSPKEEYVTHDTGLFQTTHRRVVGPGKVIDLRVAKSPLMNLTDKDEATFPKRKGKEIILPLLNIRLLIVFVLGISAILLIIMGIIIPKATIEVKPKRLSDNLELKVWASGEVSQPDPGQKTIPGKAVHFKVNEEKLFPATTEKEIKENSQGQVTIYNTSDKPLSLKQRALLTDSSGNKFYTVSAVTVPQAKQDATNTNTNTVAGETAGNASAQVSAEGSGKEFNQKEGSKLEIPGLTDSEYAGLVTVEVTQEVKGGETRTVKTVSQTDIDRARDELIEKAKSDSLEEIKNNLDADAAKLVKPEDLATEDIAFTSDKSAGQEAESFRATVSVTFFTVAFSQDDLKNLAKNIIENDREDKNGAVKVNSYRLNEAKPLENKIEVSADLEYQLIDQVDGAEIKKAVVAKKRREADEYLKGRNDIEEYSLKIWPNFLGHMPILDRRVKVEIR